MKGDLWKIEGRPIVSPKPTGRESPSSAEDMAFPPCVLRGLKQYTENITAIVTVADDGGGSGMLRQDLRMPPLETSATVWRHWQTPEPLMAGFCTTAFPKVRWRDRALEICFSRR